MLEMQKNAIWGTKDMFKYAWAESNFCAVWNVLHVETW